MGIKVKTKKDIVDLFSFFDEKTGLYKLELKAKGIVSQDVVEESNIEELIFIFNNLLLQIKKAIEDRVEEKIVY